MSKVSAKKNRVVLRIAIYVPPDHLKYKVHRKPKERTSKILNRIQDRIRDLLEEDPEVNSLLERIDGRLVVGAKTRREEHLEQEYGAEPFPVWHVE